MAENTKVTTIVTARMITMTEANTLLVFVFLKSNINYLISRKGRDI